MHLERHGHGGDVWTASELYGLDKNEFLDFSSNMNPLGPPEALGALLQKDWRRELSRYPDPECRELRKAIAKRYSVPADCILAGNGAAELIDLAVRAWSPRSVGLFTPSFSEYREAAEKAGARIVELPLRAEHGFLPELADPTFRAGLEASDLLFVGHPNNPTGRLLPPEALDALRSTGKPLILDEAFIDFSGDEERYSLLREAVTTKGLLVVRSLTKFYSIPGLRLGFIVGHPEVIARLKRLQVPWSVNALAQRIGASMLEDRMFELRTLEWIATERPWLTEQLEDLGLQVTPSSTNYLLFRLPEEAPYGLPELQAAMGRRGILLRNASTFGGLPLDRYGRTAVKLRADNERLLAALRESLKELGSVSGAAGATQATTPSGLSALTGGAASPVLAPAIMLQGTASDVGKSILTAALCRIFTQDGLRTAPFKSQNMSLNSYITPDGREIGRAQGLQADACRIAATTDMNPILLKPKKDMVAQVVVHGKPLGDYEARAYREDYVQQAEGIVQDALQRLRSSHDVIVIEGAGSPAEINLKDREIVNMRVAGWAQAPVLLVADIDRGGVFASLVGTLELLEPHERDRVKGFIINKFRGDVSLLQPGLDWLEEKTGKPVLGVIPYLHQLGLEDEDSASLQAKLAATPAPSSHAMDPAKLDIAVIRLPHLSNFTDVDPLSEEPDTVVRYVEHPSQLGRPDAVLLPGSKNTVDDLLHIRENGLADAILRYTEQGGELVGICAGYQMLGRRLLDPDHVESDRDAVDGLGLLPAVTWFTPDKRTVRVAGVARVPGAAGEALPVTGYEIHMGRTAFLEQMGSGHPGQHVGRQPDPSPAPEPSRDGDPDHVTAATGHRHPFRIAATHVDGSPSEAPHGDGAEALGGRVWGTYVHGILHNDTFRRRWLNKLAAKRGLPQVETILDLQARREAAFDRLAAEVRAHLDLPAIYAMIGK